MSDSIKVTVLVENTAFGPDIRGEHGLAFWIETGSKRVLFDTGPGPDVLVHNAQHLGIDLGSTDAVVLSHGHYDHTGGLMEVLERAGKIPVFLHPGALIPRYSQKKDGSVREIGAPSPLGESTLRGLASSLTWTTGPSPVADGIRVTGRVPRRTDYEDTGGDFYLDEACSAPDPIEDDQSLFFDTSEGTVVLLGCCHAGVVNTLRYIQEMTGGRLIHAVLGGTHLIAASEVRMDQTVHELRKMDIALLAPAHCTGARAQARIATEFPETWEPSHVGTRFEFTRAGVSRTDPTLDPTPQS
jgi:7,8-dihydropterin-6-yl-methyl-4-(beta-D-ribofuranosyl)aminobenzene 5'-phosphate synthase